jgi:hypothetical protein
MRARDISAFKRRRRIKAWKDRRAWLPKGIFAVLAALIGWSFVPSDQTWFQLLGGAASGIIALLLWHYLLVPIYRFVITIPEEEHADQQARIRELEAELHLLRSSLGRKQDLVKALGAFHQAGQVLKGRIRGLGKKPWDKSLKPAAREWEGQVKVWLDRHLPQFVGRFTNDIPRAPQQFQPGATTRAANWGNFMDRRLDNLQSIIEEIDKR